MTGPYSRTNVDILVNESVQALFEAPKDDVVVRNFDQELTKVDQETEKTEQDNVEAQKNEETTVMQSSAGDASFEVGKGSTLNKKDN